MSTKPDVRQSRTFNPLPMVGSIAQDTLDSILSKVDPELAKLFEDRNILLTGGGLISFNGAGTSVSFTTPLNLEINSHVAGGAPTVISLGSATRTISASGRMIYAVIDRSLGTATVVDDAATLPAVVAANQEVFLIAKRSDDADSTKRLYFRNGFVLNAGSSARLGQSGGSSGLAWSTIVADQTAAVSNGYFPNSGSLITITLPASASEGDIVAIAGKGAGGWKVVANTGQGISWTNQSNFASLSSVDTSDAVELICTVANTSWEVRNHEGALVIGYAGPTRLFAAGGYAGSNAGTTTIGRFVFASETYSNIAATLAVSRYTTGGVSSQVKGYTMGGSILAGETNAIDALTFSGETNAALSATLPYNSEQAGTRGISASTKGYRWGVGKPNVSTLTTDIQALVFSSETCANISSTLSLAKASGATAQSSTKGYLLGGSPNWGTPTNEVESMVIASETVSVILGTLPNAQKEISAVNSSTKGYCLGGNGATYIQAITFSGETIAVLGASMANGPAHNAAGESATKGYILGDSDITTVTQSFTFTTETPAVMTATLPVVTYSQASLQG